MSVESFFLNHPPTPDLKKTVEKNIRHEGVEETPVVHLARKLLQAGHKEIINSYISLVQETRSPYPPDDNFYTLLDSKCKMPQLALLFASSILTINNAIDSGILDHDEFYKNINGELSGIQYMLNKESFLPKREFISEEYRQQMFLEREKDPTFTTFFRNQLWIPDTHKAALECQGVLNGINRTGLLGKWEERTIHIIDPNQIPAKNESLGYSNADEDFIANLLSEI